MKKKPFIIAGMVFALVIGDLAKFFIVGGTTIVNWRLFIHPLWVAVSVAFLFVAAFVDRPRLWRALFGLYLIIFLAAYLNQYFVFTPVLTYNCMLFNAIFAVTYYLARKK